MLYTLIKQYKMMLFLLDKEELSLIAIITTEIFAILSLILDLYNLWSYLYHIKLSSLEEECKFLKTNHLEGESKCTHPKCNKLFKNGICAKKCKKRLGNNVDLSTFEALSKNNPIVIIRLIIEIFVSIFLLFFL